MILNIKILSGTGQGDMAGRIVAKILMKKVIKETRKKILPRVLIWGLHCSGKTMAGAVCR